MMILSAFAQGRSLAHLPYAIVQISLRGCLNRSMKIHYRLSPEPLQGVAGYAIGTILYPATAIPFFQVSLQSKGACQRCRIGQDSMGRFMLKVAQHRMRMAFLWQVNLKEVPLQSNSPSAINVACFVVVMVISLACTCFTSLFLR